MKHSITEAGQIYRTWMMEQQRKPVTDSFEIIRLVQEALDAGYTESEVQHALSRLRSFTAKSLDFVLREGVIAVDTQDMSVAYEWEGWDEFHTWDPTPEERAEAKRHADEARALLKKTQEVA